jgi:type II secretory pathway pseudopilin PulG
MNRPLSSFHARQAGFSVLELLLSLSLFIIISGAALSLLSMTQKRFQTEGQVLSSFQEGRLALDMIVRDVNDSGYPAANQVKAATAVTGYAVTPVAWSPVPTPCGVGTCVSPGNFDLILEELNPTTNTMQWIRYQLVGTTLWRGTVDKVVAGVGADPMVATAGVMLPYATNVMNNTLLQIPAINAAYPGTFPGGAPLPIFTYYCDTPNGPTLCTAAGAAYNLANNIREVEVTLIVLTQQPDMQTRRLRVVTLNGRGHRVNPNQ